MSAVLANTELSGPDADAAPVVIVGAGSAGMHAADRLLALDPAVPLVIYGDEPWAPYNRVRLSSLLVGEVDVEGIQSPLSLPARHRVVQHLHCEVINIDTVARTVTDYLGRSQRYRALILATGSRPYIPEIPGINKPGVFTFRDLSDVQQLMARRMRSHRAVVLGGGLLGLEAARGLQQAHTEVIIVEHSPRLMWRHLDDAAAERLREHVLSLGIMVLLQDSAVEVLGDDSVTGIRLRSGRVITCDTLVVAAGIRPNIGLALNAGLSVGRGIRVDDQLRTSAGHVYAIGECAEHRGEIYGLVAPGLEQAAVVAHSVTGRPARYRGSSAATRLKIIGQPVFSIGRTGEDEPVIQLRRVVFDAPMEGVYRKLLIARGRLVGAIAVGDWPETGRVQEAVIRQRYIWPWQLRRFMRTGRLWSEAESGQVALWPGEATVCNCTGVTRGQLSQAFRQGHCTVAALAQCTGASTVCGSCKPLLADLVGQGVVDAEPDSRILVRAAAITGLVALAILFAPAIPYADSVQAAWHWDELWRDGLIKQISGFSLLALGVLLSLISLRKRVRSVSFGGFTGWRVVHVLTGIVLAAALVAHTGLRIGANLNGWLMLSFIGVVLAGAVSGAAIGLQHALPARFARRTRALSLWAHILLLWPVPGLLGFHILKIYWF